MREETTKLNPLQRPVKGSAAPLRRAEPILGRGLPPVGAAAIAPLGWCLPAPEPLA